MKIRLWSEFISPNDLCRDDIIDILKKYSVILNYNVKYMQFTEDLFNIIRLYNDRSVPISVCTTLSNSMKLWINNDNVDKYGDYVYKVVDIIENKGLEIYGLCIDTQSQDNLQMKLYKSDSIFDRFILYTTLAIKSFKTKKLKNGS